MTSMFEAQKALIAEVKGRILSLAPEYEENIRFSFRDAKMRAMAEMDEDTGRPRLVEIGIGNTNAYTYYGYSTRAYRSMHPIEILYPNDELWNIAAMSDAELIRHDLCNNSSTVSGVQQRLIDPAEEIAIEQTTDDPWIKITMNLVVYYEIS